MFDYFHQNFKRTGTPKFKCHTKLRLIGRASEIIHEINKKLGEYFRNLFQNDIKYKSTRTAI